jgi:hypothetical protein
MSDIRKLHDLSRSFGTSAARAKLRLLKRIAEARRPGARELRLLGETVDFLRAYPDSAAILQQARALVPKLPQTENVYEYSYGVVRRLVQLHPGRLEIEWDDLEEEGPLLEALDLLVLPGETQGLEDTGISLQDWFTRSKSDPAATDLEFLLELLEGSDLPDPVQVFLFEISRLPIRYQGPGRSELEMPVPRVRYQRRPIVDARPPITRLIRQPLGDAMRGAQEMVDLALHALCARNLEIFPLIYANPADVVLADCGRNLQVALVGVLPEWRSPLESLHFFLILKNGVPIAYGPAAVFLGCCELGINLFPEFRGGETRYLYAQFMRVLHHHLGVDYFFLTRYGMGENNQDALRSGAFWFYRKLGLRPTNPAVEEIAREEEAKKAADPRHRSDLRTLRRMSHTEVYLDLSGGEHRPLDFGGLGLAESRLVASCFAGNRARAERRCASRMARLLGVDSGGRSLRVLAPILSLIPDLESWSAWDRATLGRAVYAKDGRSEAMAARQFTAHPRLGEALRQVAAAARAEA